jgi:PadR family transcriptional regulator
MYPILMRLADRGLLETSWETGHVPGRPARHLYRLTDTGRAYASSVAAGTPTTTALPATRRPQLRTGDA